MSPSLLQDIAAAYFRRLAFEYRYIRCRNTGNPRKYKRLKQWEKAMEAYWSLRKSHGLMCPKVTDERAILQAEARLEPRRWRNNREWQRGTR